MTTKVKKLEHYVHEDIIFIIFPNMEMRDIYTISKILKCKH